MITLTPLAEAKTSKIVSTSKATPAAYDITHVQSALKAKGVKRYLSIETFREVIFSFKTA